MSLESSAIDSLPSVEATLNYLVPTADKPYRYTYEPPAGVRSDNISYAPQGLRIRDARQIAARASLDEEQPS
jgi:hypothetical protein